MVRKGLDFKRKFCLENKKQHYRPFSSYFQPLFSFLLSFPNKTSQKLALIPPLSNNSLHSQNHPIQPASRPEQIEQLLFPYTYNPPIQLVQVSYSLFLATSPQTTTILISIPMVKYGSFSREGEHVLKMFEDVWRKILI